MVVQKEKMTEEKKFHWCFGTDVDQFCDCKVIDKCMKKSDEIRRKENEALFTSVRVSKL